ncbi:hypothetical protein BDBG_16359 [Blastomyces gilchristii SLH14081]|uniref:Histidinol dehydrogenase n=1 Tax=Blastomyces gilchristii (strain SLH14081) TaxID=559298 RepID=A0A179UCU9_BLAGS|nr:uncharacterized protein BDBG_16359 [Blastomyces gilchristii SLH14081]OAT04871.1 hypothetical protein BDBG_16359 [Blastomyces gilchristii SLH14081]
MSFKLSEGDIEAAVVKVSEQTIKDIKEAQANQRLPELIMLLCVHRTPPINGKIPNATMATTHLVGANEIFILGGAQAIAGMAVGTESIRKVDSIAEVPATHLLSQAEHGPDSPAVLITTSEDSAKQVMTLIDRFLETLSTAAIASTAWRSFREVVIVDSIDEAYALGDEYAFDHVQILT